MSKNKSIIKLDGPAGAMRLEELLKNNNCVIRFHMYGCFFCNKMEDEWKKLASQVQNKDLLVLDVDSDAVSSMVNPMKSSINGFPTIVYSPKGLSERYSKFEDEHARTAENMKKWLDTLSKTKSSNVSTVSKTKRRKARKSLSLKRGGAKRKRYTRKYSRKYKRNN